MDSGSMPPPLMPDGPNPIVNANIEQALSNPKVETIDELARGVMQSVDPELNREEALQRIAETRSQNLAGRLSKSPETAISRACDRVSLALKTDPNRSILEEFNDLCGPGRQFSDPDLKLQYLAMKKEQGANLGPLIDAHPNDPLVKISAEKDTQEIRSLANIFELCKREEVTDIKMSLIEGEDHELQKAILSLLIKTSKQGTTDILGVFRDGGSLPRNAARFFLDLTVPTVMQVTIDLQDTGTNDWRKLEPLLEGIDINHASLPEKIENLPEPKNLSRRIKEPYRSDLKDEIIIRRQMAAQQAKLAASQRVESDESEPVAPQEELPPAPGWQPPPLAEHEEL